MFTWPLINDNVTNEDKECLINFIKEPNVRFTNGEKVKEFEREWSKWQGIKYSVMVNSGASANYIMIAIAKHLKGSGEVIVPPIGWLSDIASVTNLGLTPVFVDVKMNNLGMDSKKIKEAITDKTIAVVLVHALGFNAMDLELIETCKEKNILLIEDCCESHGAMFGDKKVGSTGDMSNFSFYFGHHMTTIEGGMICTNSDEIYELAKLFRSHGMTREVSKETQEKYTTKYPDLNPLFIFAVPGFNMRSTELNAVLGLNQLKRLDFNIKRRTENLKIWLSALDSNRFITDYDFDGSSNFSLPLVLKSDDKSLFTAIQNVLVVNGVEYRIGTAGGGNQARQPYLVENPSSFRIHDNLDNADHIHDYGLYIGNHVELLEEQIVDLCNELNKV